MFVNYAHRGASEYYPENTLVHFMLDLQWEQMALKLMYK